MNDLRKILITKYDAIVAVKKYLDDEDRLQGKVPNERHNRWRAEAILEDVPSIDAPEDWGRYSERLWQIAYDRGKADRPQGEWIPCEERLPSKNGKYLIVGRQGAVNILPYRDGRWYGRWGVLAWMPLPKPWKGADNE